MKGNDSFQVVKIKVCKDVDHCHFKLTIFLLCDFGLGLLGSWTSWYRYNIACL